MLEARMDDLFPFEREVRNAIQEQSGDLCGHAKRLLRFWLMTDKDRGLEASDLPLIVLRILLSMSVKSCRQFRSVIELCGRAESVDASVVARAMFETALVVGFVLKPRFVPRKFDRSGKVVGKIVVADKPLTREFRALLFVTHDVLKPERFADLHGKRPGMKRYAKGMAKLATKDNVAAPYKQAIGAGWTKLLMEYPHTYSGLSISNLARSLGNPFNTWYDQVYGWQSEHVHAGDLLHHMQMDSEATTRPSWHGPVGHVRNTLMTAIAMFHATAGMMNKYVGFGVGMNTGLHALGKEYNELLKKHD
jgi:hypothetical protein